VPRRENLTCEKYRVCHLRTEFTIVSESEFMKVGLLLWRNCNDATTDKYTAFFSAEKIAWDIVG
jgi:hypothetical protein